LFNTTLRSAADYELMLRVLLKYNARVQYIPEVLVKMRAGGISNVSLKNRLRAHQEDKIAWKLNKLKPYFFTLPLKPLRKIFQYIVRN
jgi:glycosyltransferase